MNLRLWIGRSFALGALAAATLLSGCDNMPGKPAPGPEVPVPSSVVDFDTLYAQNCSGCHGDHGQNGAGLALNNPVYLALVDDATLKTVTAKGYKGGLMPGFAASAGGLLTDQQIDAIVHGMRSKWGKGDVLAGLHAPAYAAPTGTADVTHGGQVYAASCAGCHGAAGTGTKKGSILNGSYLALMDTQSLRTIVIVGRPELGMPDWRGDGGKPLTDADVTDVVAWLQAQTPKYPGQPYANSMPATQVPPPTNDTQAPPPTHGKGDKF